MAKKLIVFLLLIVCVCFFSSCGKKKQDLSASHKPKVVATTAMIGDLVHEIAKDKIDLSILITGEIDPHSYELVKGDAAKLKSASVVFYQGLGLEHGASLVSYLKSAPNTVALGEVLEKEHGHKLIYQDGYLDPHVWLDLDLWKQIVPAIKDKLISVSPENAEFFEKNALELTAKMEHLDQSIIHLLSQVPDHKKYLVTSHTAFSYFTRRYISQGEDWLSRHMAPEGLAPESQISLYDVEKVVSYISTNGISVIFTESNVSQDAINKILDVCKKSGFNVKCAEKPLFGDALFDEKGYLDMMWHNATLLHQAWYEQNTLSQN
jgi:manganese/zinc/iron transport system substrate-binding protein